MQSIMPFVSLVKSLIQQQFSLSKPQGEQGISIGQSGQGATCSAETWVRLICFSTLKPKHTASKLRYFIKHTGTLLRYITSHVAYNSNSIPLQLFLLMNIGILLFDSDQSMTLTELELVIKHTLYLPFGIVANQLPHVFTL
jgi:hypothetical protein